MTVDGPAAAASTPVAGPAAADAPAASTPAAGPAAASTPVAGDGAAPDGPGARDDTRSGDGPGTGLDSGPWHLVTVEDVSLTLPDAYPEVVLREHDAPCRTLRVPVGLAEGTAIAYALRRVPTPRPLTHELLVDLLDRHDIRVAAVRVTAVEDGIFHAELDTTGVMGRQVVPCRTSDALAVALRQRPTVPILVAEWVLDLATGD